MEEREMDKKMRRRGKEKKVNLLCIIIMYHKLNASKIEMDDVKQFVHFATDDSGREEKEREEGEEKEREEGEEKERREREEEERGEKESA